MKCRICNTNIEKPFLCLGNSPLANSYISIENLHKQENYYPLNVYFCDNCKLVQIDDFVMSNEIFNPEYAYHSSYSSTFLEHCKNYVDTIVKQLNLNKNNRVLEIGSNDGYLLQYFKPYNIQVLGVEPAREAANIAIEKGIDTHKFFFNFHYTKHMLGNLPIMDLIIANNVLAHNPDLNDFVYSMKCILKQNGIITVEFPHLLNLIKGNQFDQIYHEHFSYFSLTSAIQLFEQHELTIFNVEKIPTHGGSLRIYVKHKENTAIPRTDNVSNLLTEESDFGLNYLTTYTEFKHQVEKTKHNILRQLLYLKNNNYKLCAYSAPAKASTLLNYCGIGTDFIDYTTDKNPQKIGKYLPGCHIPIYSPYKIKEDKPDYIIIFAWNIKNEIMNELSYVKEYGGKFITLIPQPEIM